MEESVNQAGREKKIEYGLSSESVQQIAYELRSRRV